MLTAEPPLTKAPREIIRQWLLRVLDRKGWSPAKLARKSGVSPGTISRALSETEKYVMSLKNVLDIVQATGIPMPPDLGISGTAGSMAEPESTPYLGEVLAGPSKTADEKITKWEIKGYALDLAGYLPGDVVLVDPDETPKLGDIVQVQIYDLQADAAETAFREYTPPYVVTRTANRAYDKKPQLVDNERVFIRGVVIGMFRTRT